MSKMKKPSWWEEFVTFAVKGNAMALAVGTIIGAAFSTITKSLTDDIIMPIIAIFMGGIDFSEMKIVLPRLFGPEKLDEAGNVILNTLNYGNFISAVINFAILALVVFWLVKSLNKLSELSRTPIPTPLKDIDKREVRFTKTVPADRMLDEVLKFAD